MPNWGSTIQAVIPQLVTVFQDANPNVWVTDGPAVGNEDARELIAVGYDGGDGKAIAGEIAQDGFGSGPNTEVYTIYCACSAVTGDDDQKAVRDTAFLLFNNCANALALDPTLGNIVMRAIPHDIQVTQDATTAGRVCTIRFGVMIQAFTA